MNEVVYNKQHNIYYVKMKSDTEGESGISVEIDNDVDYIDLWTWEDTHDDLKNCEYVCNLEDIFKLLSDIHLDKTSKV